MDCLIIANHTKVITLKKHFCIPQFSVDDNLSTHAFINSITIFHSANSHCSLYLVLFIFPFDLLPLSSLLSIFSSVDFCCPFCFKHLFVWLFPLFFFFFPFYPQMFFSVCLASNPPNPSWASFMKMQIHSRAGKNVNRRKLPCSTNQKRRTIKNRQQQPGDPNSVQPPPEIATHACINPLQAKNMWLKELCCHLLLGTTPLPQKRAIYHRLLTQCAVWSLTHIC